MRISTVLTFSLTLMGIATLPLGQTPAAVSAGRSAAADQAAQRRNSQTTTEEGRLQSQVDILIAKVDALENRLSAMENRPATASRPPVRLTPDSAFPKRDQKADDLAMFQSAVNNLWQAIELIRADLKKLNGQ